MTERTPGDRVPVAIADGGRAGRYPRWRAGRSLTSRYVSRHCARPDCRGPASLTLTYDYAASMVWLEPLAAETHPMAHDLCALHGDSLSVPRGWQLRDRRHPKGPCVGACVGEGDHRGEDHPVLPFTDRAAGPPGALAS